MAGLACCVLGFSLFEMIISAIYFGTRFVMQPFRFITKLLWQNREAAKNDVELSASLIQSGGGAAAARSSHAPALAHDASLRMSYNSKSSLQSSGGLGGSDRQFPSQDTTGQFSSRGSGSGSRL